MGNFITLSYWFNWYPGSLNNKALIAFIVFLLLLLFFSIVFSILKNRKSIYRPIFKKIKVFSLSNLIIGIFLLFFIYQLLPILSARIWPLIWLISMMVWMGFIVKLMIKIPSIRENRLKEEAYRKYIP